MDSNNEKKAEESAVRRALEVQEIYLLYKKNELPNIYIYRHYIYPRFYISERTFYRYLARPAKKEVRQFEKI